MLNTATTTANAPFWDAFKHAMRELGYVEGRNLTVDYRSAENHLDRLPGFATELAALKPDVIVVAGSPATVALKRATATIPIVMTTVGDPVATGVVASLARPGGNVTGMSFQATDLVAKRQIGRAHV